MGAPDDVDVRQLLHDLRNPIGTAHLGLSLLLRIDDLPAEARERIDLVVRAVDQALAVIDDAAAGA